MNVGTLEIKLLANIARLQTDMDKANQTVDRAMKGIDKSVGIAKRAFGGLLTVAGGAQILRMVDDYKKFDAQLKLSTRTTQEYAAAYKDVIRISRQSQSDIAAVGVLYARLTNNLRDFGTSQKEISKIAESVSLSLRVSNATVQETSSVMLQLSQSFGSGRINGQEFLAVSEGAPIIMRQLAKSLNTTVGALKDMSAAGQLTADVLAKALSDPEYLATLREQVKEVGTISSAFVVFTNSLKVYIGESDKASGASDVIRRSIILLGDSLDFLVTAGLLVAGVAFGRFTVSVYESVKAQVASAAATQAASAQKVVLARNAVVLAEATYRSAAATGASTLALNNNAAATTNASRAAAALSLAQMRLATATGAATGALSVFRGAVAFLGGPIGALITVLGLGYVAFKQFSGGALAAESALDRALTKLNELKTLQNSSAGGNPLATELNEAAAAYSKALSEVSRQTNIHGAEVTVGMEKVAAAKKQLEGVTAAYQEAEKLIKSNTVANQELAPEVEKVTKATKDLTDAEKELQRIRENQVKADVQLTDLRAVNDLLRQGVELEEARFRVESLRAGLRPEQIESLLRERGIQEDLLEIETARQERIQWWIKDQEDLQKKELERIEDVAKANQKASEDYLNGVAKAEEDRRKEVEKTTDKINDVFRESFRELVNGGERSWKSFTKSMFTTFKTTVADQIYKLLAQPIIVKLVASVLGVGASGVASASGGGGIAEALTGGSGAGSLIDTIGNLSSVINGGLQGGIETFGAALASFGGPNSALGSLGGMLGQYSSTIASSMPFIGAGIQALTGDVKGAAFTAAGAAIGSFIPVIGTVIGGAIGSIVGSFFGGKKQPPRSGAFGFGEIKNGNETTRSGASRNFTIKSFDKATGANLQNAISFFNQSISGLTSGFGGTGNVKSDASYFGRDGGSSYQDFKSSFDGGSLKIPAFRGEFGGDDFKRFLGDITGKYLVQAIKRTDVPEGVKKFFASGMKADDIVGAINAIITMKNALGDLPPVFDAISLALYTTDFNVGIKRLTEDFGAVQKYTELFYSAQENFDTFTRQIQSQFEALNVTMPTTREGFRALVDGINVVDEATYNLFQALVRLAPATDQYYQILEKQFTLMKGIESFRTRADYQIYSGIARNYGAAAANERFPSYDVGTDFVPNDGLAMIHRGERIIPAAENAKWGEGNAALANEIRAMRQEMQAVVSNTGRSALFNRRMSDLLERISPNGDAIQTEAVS